jgi:hypothetical protein
MATDGVREIEALELELSALLEESLILMPAAIETCPVPRTAGALFSLMARADLLTKSVIACAIRDDPYSAGVLCRSVIEHHLRHSLIFFRYTEEKNDSPRRRLPEPV